MAYKWKIIKAAVEQAVLFSSEEDLNNYVNNFHREIELVSKIKHRNGNMVAIIRKPYNYSNEFLASTDSFLTRKAKVKVKRRNVITIYMINKETYIN